jgi:hypothetical protein
LVYIPLPAADFHLKYPLIYLYAGRVDVMLSRIVKVLLFSPLALLVACSGPGGGTTITGVAPDKPLIDTRVPAGVETATFALG